MYGVLPYARPPKSRAVRLPQGVMTDKTQSEHNRSAFGCIATKVAPAGGMLSPTAEP
jgi:hypothetical protein